MLPREPSWREEEMTRFSRETTTSQEGKADNVNQQEEKKKRLFDIQGNISTQ